MHTNHVPAEIIMMPEFVLAMRDADFEDYGDLSPEEVNKQLQAVVKVASHCPNSIRYLPSHIKAADAQIDACRERASLDCVAASIDALKAAGRV